mmetsp:Transcript_17547/g.43162  ORF Transcript_17547/g.43162 Transcript_17547/m.43162 type:complete len:1091 (-) Transcript_17547:73-3345(-)
MATAVAGQAPPQRQQAPPALPLFDQFLDLPHPAATTNCPPPFSLSAPGTTAEMEKELASNLSRVARFAFPEFDDALATNVPRDTILNHFSKYAMQPKGFQHYTFSLQLQTGVRLQGHVRRYLPIHLDAKSRYDIGRRGERALVLLTRNSGSDLVYSAILKTIDGLSSQNFAMNDDVKPHEEPQKWFLHKLFHQHQHLCARFNSLPFEQRKPMLLNVDRLEAGEKRIAGLEQVDAARFLLPTELLHATPSALETVTNASTLPLLRVLGVENSMRLISGLLSECRILLISHSPTRLAQCARSALSILAQGLLNWQHVYIPVLPPHLFQYIAAPMPYLMGMLSSMVPRLEQAKDLGELIIINLDLNRMETRGINPGDVDRKIPDLFRRGVGDTATPQGSMSATEMLAQDLLDLLKADKRALYGESGLTNVAETAAKATKALKSGFSKLRNKGKKLLQKQSFDSTGSGDELDDGGVEVAEDEAEKQLPDYIFTQGAQNEQAEEEARIAFTSFFLATFGNMRWYLSAKPGKLPELDKQRFLQQKKALGEEYSAMWPLLQNFCQTQMLVQFAKARVEEVRTRYPVTAASPLFAKCTAYHRQHNVDFSVVNVRSVARQVAQQNPSRVILQTSARKMAMALTSNKTFEGDYNKAVSQLVEQCRECSSVLFDVMSVVWVRIRDSKGLHWKHGFQALQILRNLLYHGPVAAIAEATDGLDKIRFMKYYNDNMRPQICTQIRQAAQQVYNLLVDRAKLFNIRRVCINKRRIMRKSDPGRYMRETRIKINMPFGKIHAAFNPKARGQIAPAPQYGGGADLLGMIAPAPAHMQQQQQPVAPNAPKPGAGDDLLSIFQNASISQPQQSGARTPPPHDPFAAAPQPQGGSAMPPAQTAAPPPAAAAQPAPQPGHPHGYGTQPAAVPPGAAPPVARPAAGYPPNAGAVPQMQTTQGYPGHQGVPQPQQQPGFGVQNPPRSLSPGPPRPQAPGYAPQGYQQGVPPQGMAHQGVPPPQQGMPLHAQGQMPGYPPHVQRQPPQHPGYQQAPMQYQNPHAAYPPGHPHQQHVAQQQAYRGVPPQQQQQQYQQQPPQQQQRPPAAQFDPFG